MNRVVKTALESLTVYRGILRDEAVNALYLVLKDVTNKSINFSDFINGYCDFYYKLVNHNPEVCFKDYLIEKIIFDDNAFSKLCEKVTLDCVGESLVKAVENDLACLNVVSSVSAKDIKEAALKILDKSGSENDIITNLPEWSQGNGKDNIPANILTTEVGEIFKLFKSSDDWRKCLKPMADFYKKNGSGMFANYKGFVWEKNQGKGYLKGVSYTDPVRFSDLIGYELQRKEVIDNTLQFLKGYPANNILLYGDRGTGKSSTLKALLNEYSHLGLRLIELPKAYLADLPHVLREIRDRQLRFIIFIDDLAFSDNEENYTALKAVLEGGLESKPQNVVIYATSNRRHLIKERFSERSGLASGNYDDEVRAADTLQEKLSLADRFGITITFSSPDQKEYLEIVDGLARNRKLNIDAETLHREALRWELHYNGRSPRTARQFIDWLEGRVSNL